MFKSDWFSSVSVLTFLLKSQTHEILQKNLCRGLKCTPSRSSGCATCTYGQLWCTALRDPTLDRAAVKRAVPGSSHLPHLTWQVDALKLSSQPLVPAWARLQLRLAEHLADPQISAPGLASGLPLTVDLRHKLSLARTASPALLEVPGCTLGTAPACCAAAPGQPSLQSCSLLLLPGSLFAGSTITFFLPESQKSQWIY